MKLSDERLEEILLEQHSTPPALSEVEYMIAELRVSRARLAKADRLAEAFKRFYATMTMINQHRGYEFSQPLLNAHDALTEWDAP